MQLYFFKRSFYTLGFAQQSPMQSWVFVVCSRSQSILLVSGDHCVEDNLQPPHMDNVTSRLYLIFILLREVITAGVGQSPMQSCRFLQTLASILLVKGGHCVWNWERIPLCTKWTLHPEMSTFLSIKQTKTSAHVSQIICYEKEENTHLRLEKKDVCRQ